MSDRPPDTPPVWEGQIDENLDAPEIYCEGYNRSMITSTGVIKLNLISHYANERTNTLRGRVVARLSINGPNLVHMHKALGELIEYFRKNGAIK